MSIIFFGSSDFSLPALRACLESCFKVSLVITTPDRRKGRGLKFGPTPVKSFALDEGLPVVSPETLKNPELVQRVKELRPAFFVVSSYGKFIPSSWLALPSRYALNVHPSLLPKYRGAAPVNWAILNGERETGVSIAEVTPELDAGDIFQQEVVPLDEEIDALALTQRLAELSYHVLGQVLQRAQSGELQRRPQEKALASYARKLNKGDGLIDWSKPAQTIQNQIRGLLPWPSAFTFFRSRRIRLLKARLSRVGCSEAKAGEIVAIQEGALMVQTGEGALQLEWVQLEGKKAMPAGDFACGQRIKPGDRFDTLPADGGKKP